MPRLRLVYNCDHNVIDREYLVTTIAMTKGSGNSDKIENYNVVSIGSITTDNVVLSPEIYNLYNNSIIWVNNDSSKVGTYRTPAEGEQYNVTIKYMDISVQRYQPQDCVRCGGSNWYMTPVHEGDSLQLATGAYLVAQEFLKYLLTVPNTDRLDPTYGSGLITDTGILTFDNNLMNKVNSAISLAEAKCRELGAADPNRNDNEILDKVIVESIELDEGNGGIFIYITLLTVGGSQARLNLKV